MLTLLKIIAAIVIHLIIPVLGVILFLKIQRRMENENIKEPPTLELLLIFSTYGGLLLVILTALFWVWSGMASLGCFYLTLGAPIAMSIIFWRLFEKRNLSVYHKWIFRLACLYLILLPVVLILFYFLGR
jgi:hypothetical protein